MDCLKKNATIDDDLIRYACSGCCNGASTGNTHSSAANTFLRHASLVGPIINKLAGEHAGEQAFASRRTQAKAIYLQLGSKYDQSSANLPAPSSGYFEFFNKSDSPCALKVLISGCDSIWEVPRPSYILIGPNMTAYGEFGPAISLIDIIVLVNYPSTDNALSRSASQKKHDMSKFRDFIIYRTHCQGCNVLLKYKDPGSVEPRQGGSSFPAYEATLSLMAGSASEKRRSQAITADIVDFRTNVSKVDQLFTSFI